MDVCIEKITAGIHKYIAIRERLYAVDVSEDLGFQRQFNGCYRMRQRSQKFYSTFYAYLEREKNNPSLTFSQVLTYLYEQTGVITPSFSSKLLATVRPEMPVWDRFVLKNGGLKAPYYGDKKRMEKTEEVYRAICDWYTTPAAKDCLAVFSAHFPHVPITDTKKLTLFCGRLSRSDRIKMDISRLHLRFCANRTDTTAKRQPKKGGVPNPGDPKTDIRKKRERSDLGHSVLCFIRKSRSVRLRIPCSRWYSEEIGMLSRQAIFWIWPEKKSGKWAKGYRFALLAKERAAAYCKVRHSQSEIRRTGDGTTFRL